jgi:hypothetical protein
MRHPELIVTEPAADREDPQRPAFIDPADKGLQPLVIGTPQIAATIRRGKILWKADLVRIDFVAGTRIREAPA